MIISLAGSKIPAKSHGRAEEAIFYYFLTG
jgi:hypothetical protein